MKYNYTISDVTGAIPGSEPNIIATFETKEPLPHLAIDGVLRLPVDLVNGVDEAGSRPWRIERVSVLPRLKNKMLDDNSTVEIMVFVTGK